MAISRRLTPIRRRATIRAKGRGSVSYTHLRIDYDVWFHESTLHESGAVMAVVDKLLRCV